MTVTLVTRRTPQAGVRHLIGAALALGSNLLVSAASAQAMPEPAAPDFVISDLTAAFGWAATVLLTLNLVLGIMQPLRYSTVRQWPHLRLPASLFTFHKYIGYAAIAVILAHPIFLLWHAKEPFTLGAIYIPFTAPAETIHAAMGTIAFYLVLIVTATSFFRKQLGLESWKIIHYASYAAVPIFLAHGLLINSSLDPKVEIDYFDAGKVIVETSILISIAFIAWRLRTAYARNRAPAEVAVGSDTEVYQGRFLTVPSASYAFKLTEIIRETPQISTFRFRSASGGKLPFNFVAGQHVQLSRIRNYTVSSSPLETAYFDCTVKKEVGGFFSQHLHNDLAIGRPVTVLAPAGSFTFSGREAEAVTMIAGGVGVTPFLSMLRYLEQIRYSGTVNLIYAVWAETDIVRRQYLDGLMASHPRFQVFYTIEDGPISIVHGARGRITGDILKAVVPRLSDGPVYICGPDAMMSSVTEIAAGLGVPRERILTESFSDVIGPRPGADAARIDQAA